MMGAYFAKVFWGMIYIICTIAICGILQGLSQFTFYICPKIINICKCIKDKFCNIYNLGTNINLPYCNKKIINKILKKNINKVIVKKAKINPLPIINNLPV